MNGHLQSYYFIPHLATNSDMHSSLVLAKRCLQEHPMLSSCSHSSHSQDTYHFLLNVVVLYVSGFFFFSHNEV